MSLPHVHTQLLLRSLSQPVVSTRIHTLTPALSSSLAHTGMHPNMPAQVPTRVLALVLVCSDACTPDCLRLFTYARTGWCGRACTRTCAHPCGPACQPASVLSCERACTRAPGHAGTRALVAALMHTGLRPPGPAPRQPFPRPDCQLQVRAHGGECVRASTQRLSRPFMPWRVLPLGRLPGGALGPPFDSWTVVAQVARGVASTFQG